MTAAGRRYAAVSIVANRQRAAGVSVTPEAVRFLRGTRGHPRRAALALTWIDSPAPESPVTAAHCL